MDARKKEAENLDPSVNNPSTKNKKGLGFKPFQSTLSRFKFMKLHKATRSWGKGYVYQENVICRSRDAIENSAYHLAWKLPNDDVDNGDILAFVEEFEYFPNYHRTSTSFGLLFINISKKTAFIVEQAGDEVTKSIVPLEDYK